MKITELTDQFAVNDVIQTLRHGTGTIERIVNTNGTRVIYMRKKDNKVVAISPNEIVSDQPWNGIGFDPTDRAPSNAAGAIPMNMNI